MKQFPYSYWPEVSLRPRVKSGARHIYELRSYHLKPGTMVEWGNFWARAIRLREYKNSEPYLGTFSQVGLWLIINRLGNWECVLFFRLVICIMWTTVCWIGKKPEILYGTKKAKSGAKLWATPCLWSGRCHPAWFIPWIIRPRNKKLTNYRVLKNTFIKLLMFCWHVLLFLAILGLFLFGHR